MKSALYTQCNKKIQIKLFISNCAAHHSIRDSTGHGRLDLEMRTKKSKQNETSVSTLWRFKSTETQTPTRHFVFSYFSNQHL